MLLRKRVGNAIGILSLCLFASNVFAIGLGKLTVNSKLDQPFDGIVDLTSATGSELAALQAQFANSEELARSGIKRLGGSSNLNIELVNNGNRAHIRVTSEQAVTDPFMQFVISLTWPKGKVVREYTALIDPPEYGIAGVATSNTASSQTSAGETKTTTTAMQSSSTSGGSNATDKVIVKRGDTVWSIVSRLRLPAGADEFQMAMALLRSNPAAFPNKNFNSLEAGTVLAVPGAADVTSISKSKAAQEFAALSDAKSGTTTVAKQETDKQETVEQKVVEKAVQKTQAAATTTTASTTGTYGPVKDGETLWSIASRLPRAGGADAFQMAVALFQVNPGAFSDGTINSLNGGSVLKIPGVAELSKVTDQQVSQAFGTPYSGPKIDPNIDASAATTDMQSVEQVVEKTEPMIGEPEEVASAMTPEAELPESDENVEALVQRINELEESLAPKEEENLALREQIAMLEQQIEQKAASTQAVVENMINEAGEEPQVETQTDTTTVASTETEAMTEDTMSSDGSSQSEASQIMDTVSDSVAEQTQAVESAGSEIADGVEKVVEDVASTANESTQSAKNIVSETVSDVDNDTTAKTRVTAEASAPWWDRLIPANPIGGIDIKQMGVLAGGVALIGLGTMLFLRRRRSADEELDEYVPEPAMEVPSVSTKSAEIPQAASKAATPIGAERVTNGKIDPVAEAEVYVAYGREHEAEQVLRDALTENPDQPDVQLKLLEVYRRSHNTAAFTAMATELKGKWADSKPELWEQVVTQGQDLLPGNALFESSDSTSVQYEEAATVATPTPTEATVEFPDESSAVQVAGSSLDLPSKDIGVGNKEIGITGASSDDEFTIAFDSDGGDTSPTVAEIKVEESDVDTNESSSSVVSSNADMSAALDALQSSGVNVESPASTVQEIADADNHSDGDSDRQSDDDTLLEKAMKRAAPAGTVAAAAGTVAAVSSKFDDEPSLTELSASIKDKIQETAEDTGDEIAEAISGEIPDEEETPGETPTIDISELTDDDDDITASLDAIVSDSTATPATEVDGLDFNTEDLQVSAPNESDTSSNNGVSEPSSSTESRATAEGGDDPLQWDAIGTKLDLAKAYIDMGDAASASGLIDEAMREGNEQQRSQAAALAAQLPSG